MGQQPAVILGKISYPLYLWHWPLLSIAFIVQDGQPSAQLRLIMVTLALVLSVLTWLLLEKKIQAIPLPPELTMNSLRFLTVGIAALALTVIFAQRTISAEGYPERFPVTIPVADKIVIPPTDCSQKFRTGDSYCQQTSSSPETALIGDSHAEKFFSGMLVRDSAVGRSLILLGDNSCPYPLSSM